MRDAEQGDRARRQSKAMQSKAFPREAIKARRGEAGRRRRSGEAVWGLRRRRHTAHEHGEPKAVLGFKDEQVVARTKDCPLGAVTKAAEM